MPAWSHVALGVLALCQIFLTSGVYYGINSLVPVLAENGISASQIGTVLVIASSCSLIGTFVIGFVLDRCGPRACFCLCTAAVAASFLLLGILGTHSVPVVGSAITLVAFFGPTIQNSLIHVSRLFPKYQSTYTSTITASFQMSSIVYLVLKTIAGTYRTSLSHILLCYAFVSIASLIIGAFVWPDAPFSPPQTAAATVVPEPYLPSQELEEALVVPQDKKLRDKTVFSKQLYSMEFFHLTIFFVVSSFWCNFYLGTLSQQLQQYIDDPGRRTYFLDLFSILTTASAVSVPLAGLLLDRYGFGATQLLTISFGVIMAIGTLLPFGGSPEQQDAILISTFVFYGLYRNFVFAYTFSAFAHIFGFQFFGTLVGVAFLIAGCVGFLQKLLAGVQQWQAVNQTQLFTILLLYLLPLYGMWSQRQAMKGKVVEGDTDFKEDETLYTFMDKDTLPKDTPNPLAFGKKRPTLFNAYGSHNRRLAKNGTTSTYGSV